jgi:hypothetical protein
MKLTGAAILVSRGMKVLQAAPAAYPYRSATRLWERPKNRTLTRSKQMYKLNSGMPLACGIIVTLSLASAAAGGDKAADYLKNGKLKERLVFEVDKDDADRSGEYIVIEPDGSWAHGGKLGGKRSAEFKKGKLTEVQLSQLAKALAQYGLATLPNHAGKNKSPDTITITFGKKSATCSGGIKGSDSKEDQVVVRYADIAKAMGEAIYEEPKRKK